MMHSGDTLGLQVLIRKHKVLYIKKTFFSVRINGVS